MELFTDPVCVLRGNRFLAGRGEYRVRRVATEPGISVLVEIWRERPGISVLVEIQRKTGNFRVS